MSSIVETEAQIPRLLIFLLAAVPITVIDIRQYRIPDVLSLGGLGFLFAFDLFMFPRMLVSESLLAFFAFGLFLFLRATTKGLGFGDVKYAALIAFFSGLPFFFAALIAAASGGIGYWILCRAVWHRTANTRNPFAPFLSAGALVAFCLQVSGLDA
jgi:leader peptidase (prepilin peptidase) / N-methyltransferase